MKKCIIILFILGFLHSRAQNPDSIITPATSLQAAPLHLSGDLSAKKTDRYARALIVPASLIGYGFIALGNDGLKTLNKSTRTEIKEHHAEYVTKLDNYLQHAPALAVYGLNALGIKGKNNFRDRTIIYALSSVISTAIVLPLKHITKIQRPDGSSFSSFPSGHTATAFGAAEFMRQEYKDISPWYGIAGYGAATFTGILRLYNNRHWVSDVMAGAGFGILSTRLAYWTYPVIKKMLLKNKISGTTITPFYQSGGGGISMIHRFRHV